MSFLPIFRLLNADANVQAVLGSELRVYEDVAPTGVTVPYVIWAEVGGSAENDLDAPASVDHVMSQVMVYDTDRKRVYEVRDLVRTVLEQHSYILNPRISHYESNTKLFVRGFDGNWFLDR